MSKFKYFLISLAVFAGVVMVGGLALGILYFGYTSSKVEVYDNIEDYKNYRSGKDAEENFKSKWGMDESIWPEKITESMNVLDYRMVYYNPWDAQYLGYLVVDYSPEDYATEVERLKSYPSTDYIGYYGVTGENAYELLAVNADEYQGFVYALTDGENTIIYAEQIFCNYFMDLDYKQYIPEEYLLDGFDAASGNPYEKSHIQH